MTDELPPLDEPPDDVPEEQPEPAPPPKPRAKQRRRVLRRRAPRAASGTRSSAQESRKPKPAPASDKERILSELTEDLISAHVMVGTALTPVMPVTGLTIANRAGMSTDLIIGVARRDERVYKALVNIMLYSDWAKLGILVGTVVVAAGVDVGRVPEESIVAQRLVGEEIAQVQELRREYEQRVATPPSPAWSPS